MSAFRFEGRAKVHAIMMFSTWHLLSVLMLNGAVSMWIIYKWKSTEPVLWSYLVYQSSSQKGKLTRMVAALTALANPGGITIFLAYLLSMVDGADTEDFERTLASDPKAASFMDRIQKQMAELGNVVSNCVYLYSGPGTASCHIKKQAKHILHSKGGHVLRELWDLDAELCAQSRATFAQTLRAEGPTRPPPGFDRGGMLQ